MDYMSPMTLTNYSMEPLPHALISSSPTMSPSSPSSPNQPRRSHSRHGSSTTNLQLPSSQGRSTPTMKPPTQSGFHHHQYTQPILYQNSQDHHHHCHPSSPNSAATDAFGEQHRDTTPSQYTPQSNNNNNNFNPTQYEHATFSVPGSTSLSTTTGPHSAPERVAFKIYTGPFSSLGSAATSRLYLVPITMGVRIRLVLLLPLDRGNRITPTPPTTTRRLLRLRRRLRHLRRYRFWIKI